MSPENPPCAQCALYGYPTCLHRRFECAVATPGVPPAPSAWMSHPAYDPAGAAVAHARAVDAEPGHPILAAGGALVWVREGQNPPTCWDVEAVAQPTYSAIPYRAD